MDKYDEKLDKFLIEHFKPEDTPSNELKKSIHKKLLLNEQKMLLKNTFLLVLSIISYSTIIIMVGLIFVNSIITIGLLLINLFLTILGAITIWFINKKDMLKEGRFKNVIL